MKGAHGHFAGVLGWPLTHTLSPAIHNAAFRRMAIECVYLAWPVPPEELGDAVRGLRALGAMGANVTMPHKETIVEFLDDLSGDARAIGAVNTVQNVSGALIGHNTDVDGFREFVAGDAGHDLSGSTALVLGAGGAARAVVRALEELGASSVAVAARTKEKGVGLLGAVGGSVARLESWDDAGEIASGADVIINATPVGSNGEDPIPTARFAAGQIVIDLLYDPPTTLLLERARSAGADAWGGLGMLVRQAAASLQIWTGQDPPLETMSAAAVRGVGGLR